MATVLSQFIPASGRPRRLVSHRWRVFFFYWAAALLTGFVAILFVDLLWRTGWSMSRNLLLGVFIVLFFLSAVGCMHGVFGFFVRRFGDKRRITRRVDYRSQSIAGTSTALIFPIYNENVVRVCEGLRATFESLQKTGQLERFDFFILSDSTDPDKWVEEERRWCDLLRELSANGRIYYRRRLSNEGKKSGNVRDFLTTWGARYRYFIIFDADSVMRGETIVNMVKLMEACPSAGLIQTAPALANAKSLFGRMQQFANRFYSPIFISGLNFWTQNFGNYWGHNAIIRTAPFMQHCDLPLLPGPKPFGGPILSHDFVEAALLLKENWEVWFAYDLDGSYEEAPQDMIENARRDRRWCQGNLQHALVLFASGLRGVSRLHLFFGTCVYFAGPLWLLFLLLSNWMLWFKTRTGLSDITVHSFTQILSLSATQHALLLFGICMAVIFLPKLLALVDLALDRERRRAFGGVTRALFGMVIETIFSALHAPLQMLWHTRFVATILLGMTVKWGPQSRKADGITWAFAAGRLWSHTVIGLVWGAFNWFALPATFWWFAPVLAGMVLSIPLSVLTSRSSWGKRARELGLLLTPEEISPPPELISLRTRMAELEAAGETEQRPVGFGIGALILDPCVNAIHVSLLREMRLNPGFAKSMIKLAARGWNGHALGEKLLTERPDTLKPEESLFVLSDPETMIWLHRQAWRRPEETLPTAWLAVLSRPQCKDDLAEIQPRPGPCKIGLPSHQQKGAFRF